MRQTPLLDKYADVLLEEVSALLRKGAIEPVPEKERDGYYSTYFLVPKKTGDLRPILNLKRLNLCVVKPTFKKKKQAAADAKKTKAVKEVLPKPNPKGRPLKTTCAGCLDPRHERRRPSVEQSAGWLGAWMEWCGPVPLATPRWLMPCTPAPRQEPSGCCVPDADYRQGCCTANNEGDQEANIDETLVVQ